ncbi:hypothetical protein NFI96_010288 [Prochilodus magdalenae]|nr:hypothetical protein NFI96_010288 [Prochilodus magdalenae]
MQMVLDIKRKISHQKAPAQLSRMPECRGTPVIPRMADLEPSSLHLHQPAFYFTGVDCFGSYLIKIGRRTEKRWGIIFKCLTTHLLDLLARMDTDAFLMALRRFSARRGKPDKLLSDQGTNFQGGSLELKEAFNALTQAVQAHLSSQQIQFRFNPPNAPYFGGSWEREIRSIKSALHTILGSQTITEDVLMTVLIEEEVQITIIAMESELENLQIEVKEALLKLSTKQLVEIWDALQIPQPELKAKTQNVLISHIIKYLESEEVTAVEDEGMTELLSLKDMIDKIQAAEECEDLEISKPNSDEEQENLRRDLEQLKLMVQLKEAEMQRHISRTVQHRTSGVTTPIVKSSIQVTYSHWCKDFKISGQIGEPGQKDRLTFSTLARQIESGLTRGYCEPEIVDAVIRAIVPGLQLQSYLEGKTDLILPTLRRILRSHYQESATELYKQLTTEVQSSKETPQNFLMHNGFETILFASQEAESSLKYDPTLVQSLFMHAVLTGLQNDNIKSDLQPYLMQTTTSDELLLEKLNVACANEKERQEKKKQFTQQKSVNVHVVQSGGSDVVTKGFVQTSSTSVPPDILSELKEIKLDFLSLKDLKAEVSQISIVLSPLLYTLYTHDCIATYSSNTIIKFANDTTIINNITKDDKGPYREEVKLLTEWCATNNLAHNVNKTKKLIIDFRRRGRTHKPLNIGGTLVERMSMVVGRLTPTDLCAAFTTLCRAFLSAAEQLPCHTLMLEHRTLSTTHL